MFFQPNQQRFDSCSSAYKRKASQSNCAAAIIPSDSIVLQAYLTIMQWACGAEAPFPPYLAEGSCRVPRGAAVAPIWVPVSAVLAPATFRVAAATSPVALGHQHPITCAGSITSDCSLSLAPRDGFLPAELLFIAAGYHDQIEGCFPRNGKLNCPSVSDIGRKGGNHWPSLCQDGSSNFASNELACACSSSKPNSERSSSFSHRITCQSVAVSLPHRWGCNAAPLHSSP